MARVELAPPADLTTDTLGNVLSGRTVTVKIAGTSTDATHYSATTGGTSTTGGLVTYTDGSVRDGSGNRRYFDSGQSVDVTIAGVTHTIQLLSAANEPIQVAAPTGTASTDRAMIQAALDSATTGDTVRLAYGVTYTVDSPGSATSPSHGVTTYAYCLQIPNGVTLDLNSSTIKLATGVLATVVRAASGANNVGLIGYPGTIDGNNNALVDLSGYLVWFDTVTGLELDLRVINGVHGGVVLEACSKVHAPRIVVDTIVGVGVGLGNGSATVSDSWFGYIEVRNVTNWPTNPTNFPGNPVAGVMTDSHVEVCRVVSNEAGIKVDAGSTDWTFGTVYIKGGTSTSNSGLKFQGAGAGTPLRCHAEHVHAVGNGGQGLYMEQCTDCSVGTYIGQGNNTGGTASDVWIGGTRDAVSLIRSAGSKFPPVQIRSTAADYRLGIVRVYNPANTSNGVTDAGGSGAIGQLIALDDRGGSALMDRGYRSNSANSVCHIGYADIRGATVAPFTRTTGDKLSVGLLRSVATTDMESQTLATDAAFTLTPGTSPKVTYHTGTLTADRALTLSTTGAWPGATFKVVRSGGGAFNITNALKNIATNQWAIFRFDGATAAWKLDGFGSL